MQGIIVHKFGFYTDKVLFNGYKLPNKIVLLFP